MVTTILIVLGGWLLLSVLFTAFWATAHLLVQAGQPADTTGQVAHTDTTAYGDRPVRAPHRVAH